MDDLSNTDTDTDKALADAAISEISGRLTDDNLFTPSANGVCPKVGCAKPAPAYRPPTRDFKYIDWHAQVKAQFGLTDEEAHDACLRLNGGHITFCTQCGTSYFVRYESKA